MNAVEIIAVVVAAAAFLAAISYLIVRKIRRKGACCDCDGGCASCHCCKDKK